MVPASVEHLPSDLLGAGQYPLLQLGGAIAIIAATVLAYAYAQRAKLPPPPPSAAADGGVQIFLGGPVGQAIEYLKVIAETVVALKTIPALLAQHQNEIGDRMRADRREMYGRIDQERRELDVEGARRDERLNDLGERLARLEGQQEQGRRR